MRSLLRFAHPSKAERAACLSPTLIGQHPIPCMRSFLEGMEMNEERYLALLAKLIGEAEHLQNNPAQASRLGLSYVFSGLRRSRVQPKASTVSHPHLPHQQRTGPGAAGGQGGGPRAGGARALHQGERRAPPGACPLQS